MKQRFLSVISLVLACALLAGCAAIPANEGQPAAEEEVGPVLSVGDSVHGFVVRELIPMDALGATGVRFEHEKTGATLLYLDCEDTNRSFDIAFRTPALDDKGKPHVFEHITICGSQKYPDASLFFPFAYQTYNTFVNAITYHGMTTYPLASLSEDQLMTMMDYYLSGVFQPLLYTEPRLAQREAWRYELADADAELSIAGTVYSEMQGALTLAAQAINNDMATLYEGSATAHESGGIPESIKTLTYDELVEFHDTYYHPSNVLITLYGDLDIDRFLEYIDSEYLSGYDKKDVFIEMGTVEPYTETKYAEYEAPVEKDAPTDKTSVINYSFALNGADMYDTFAMSALSEVLLQESSPVMQAIRKALPHAQISGYVNFDSPSAPYFTLIANGVNPEDRDPFVAAVDEGLQALASDGISADALDSVLAINKLALLTAQEDTDLGVNASCQIALAWVYFDSIEYYPTYEAVLDEMTEESANALIKQYITDNRHRAVTVTKPAAGMTEKNAEALSTELAQIKAAMSEEEIAEIVKRGAEFVEWANTPTSDEVLSKLVNMSVADLPEERRHYDVVEETADGVSYKSAVADVSGVYSGQIMLDGSTLPIDRLQDAQVCLQLLGKLDTGAHSKEELSTTLTRYLSGFSAALTAAAGYDDAGYYAASLSWIGLEEDMQTSAALLRELLFETDYSDTETIKSLLSRWSSDFTASIDNISLNIQLSRCAAMINDYLAYREHVSNYGQYAHMQELIALADADPAALTARLNEARELLLNRAGATVLCAGSANAIAAYQNEASDILADMASEERQKVDYSSLRIPRRSEGVITNSTVQMNLIFSDYSGFTGKDTVTRATIDDMYMLQQLRNVLGAYGAYTNLDRMSSALYTYRDPNLERSYEIFAALPEYLRNAEFTQEDVDRYIIGSYSGLSRPDGLLSGAIKAMSDTLIGCSEEMRLQWMKDAKSATVEDVVASADTWDELLQNGVRSSSGTESALMAASGLFDVLVYPDGTIKELAALEPAA